MRWTHTVVLAALAVAAVPAHGDAVVTRRLRAPVEWNDLYLQILDTAVQNPTRAGKLSKAADYALRANPTVEGDLFDLIEVNGMVERAVHTPSQPQSLRDAFAALGTKLGEITNLVLDGFQEEIDTFVSVNPDRKVTSQRKALQIARGFAAKAAQKDPKFFAQRAMLFRRAIDQIRTVKLFPYVAKSRKGDCTGGSKFALQKGEFAYGPWAVYDFASQNVEAIYFEANWGNAQVRLDDQGAPRSLDLNFGYCDGRGTSVSAVQISIANPAAGEFGLANSVGGFYRGLGFGSTMTSGSKLTITSLNLVDGFVAGKVDFVATNGSGRGSAEFVMRIDP